MIGRIIIVQAEGGHVFDDRGIEVQLAFSGQHRSRCGRKGLGAAGDLVERIAGGGLRFVVLQPHAVTQQHLAVLHHADSRRGNLPNFQLLRQMGAQIVQPIVHKAHTFLPRAHPPPNAFVFIPSPF